MQTQHLLIRLNEIARSLEESEHALALLGLGSAGLELQRLDEYSDLDFFVIVEPGYKRAYLDDLEWLGVLCPITFSYRNTQDGYKLLYEDGIFCEFAVFEPDELQTIPFAQGRIVWKQPHVPDSISQPLKDLASPSRREPEWLLGEALTNLYVGMAREKRGEHLSAARFIQGYAVDRLVELTDLLEKSRPVQQDDFAPDRRFEQRYPGIAEHIAMWMQGYGRNIESALAILNYLEQNFTINPAIAVAIRRLCQ